MESTLVHRARLIEYPNDLSGCDAMEIGQKNLHYLCSISDRGMPFVVVLGFYAGQKEDFVTKDLIEPVDESNHHSDGGGGKVSCAQYSEAYIFFL